MSDPSTEKVDDIDRVEEDLFNKAVIGYADDVDFDIEESDEEDNEEDENFVVDNDTQNVVIKNVVKRNIVKNRTTSDYMSQNEFTSVVATRISLIDSNDDLIFVNYKKDQVHREESTVIALLEIIYKRCPLSIMRHVEGNDYECWSVNDMAFDTEFIKKLGFDLGTLQSLYLSENLSAATTGTA